MGDGLSEWYVEARFVAMQDQYNLIKREEEREMLPMCADMGSTVSRIRPKERGA